MHCYSRRTNAQLCMRTLTAGEQSNTAGEQTNMSSEVMKTKTLLALAVPAPPLRRMDIVVVRGEK
jgi:hypothetical protein